MKIINVELRNVKKHEFLNINMNGESCIIQGPNGSGKSTIAESIFFALFRETVLPNKDALIKKDITENDKSYIKIIFDHLGDRYLLESPLNYEKGLLKNLSQNKILATKKSDIVYFITNDLLKINAEHFLELIYCEQLSLFNFLSKNSSTRQNLFDRLIGLEFFQKLNTHLGTALSVLNKKYSEVEYKLLENKIENKKKEKDAIEILIQDLNRDIINLKDEISEKEEEINQICNQEAQILTVYSDIKNKIKNLEEYKTIKIRLENEINTIGSNLAKNKSAQVKELLFEYDQKMAETDKELEGIKSFARFLHKYVPIWIKGKNSLLNEYQQKLLVKTEYEKKSVRQEELKRMIDVEVNEIKKCNEDIEKQGKRMKDFEDNKQKAETDVLIFEKQLQELRIEYEKSQEFFKNNTCLNRELLADIFKKRDKKRLDEYITELEKKNILLKCPICLNEIDIEKVKNRLQSDFKRCTEAINNGLEIKEKKEQTKKQIEFYIKEIEKCRSILNFLEKERVKRESLMQSYEKELHEIEKSKEIVCTVDSEIVEKIQRLQEELNFLLQNNEIKILLSMCTEKDTIEIDDNCDYNYNIDIETIKEKVKLNYQRYKQNMEFKNKILSEKQNLHDLIAKIKILEAQLTEKEKELNEYTDKIAKYEKYLQEKYGEDYYCNYQNMEQNILKIKEEKNKCEINLRFLQQEFQKKQTELDKNIKQLQDLENEIKSLEEQYKNSKTVMTKIKNAENAREYLRYEGLAMQIRKIYIEEINKYLERYYSIFKFDWQPKVLEDVSIERQHELSGGQKVAISILLRIIFNLLIKQNLGILILDEPTAYLDNERVEIIKDILEEMSKKIQIILITHEPKLLELKNYKRICL